MTAPYLPPIKSVEGITLREALTYERTVDDGEEVPPPGTTAPTPTPTDLAFHAGPWRKRLVEQPAAATQYWPVRRPRFNTATFTHVRLVAQVRVAGATGSYARLEYSTDKATWGNPGIGGAEVTLPFATASGAGDTAGAGIPLRTEAQADVWWRVLAVGGDGTESPEIAGLSAQFTTEATMARQRLYWRPSASSIVPDIPALVTTTSVLTQTCADGECQPPVTPFVSTVPAAPLTSVMELLPTKGAGSSGLNGNTDSDHKDWAGHVGRFVYRELAAQTFPATVVVVGCAGSIASALPIGGGVAVGYGIYRPSTETWVASGTASAGRPGFFTGSRGRILAIPMESFEIEEGDVEVLDVAASIEVGCSCGPFAHAQSFPVFIGYNGSYDAFTHDQDLTGTPPASYVDRPRLRTI